MFMLSWLSNDVLAKAKKTLALIAVVLAVLVSASVPGQAKAQNVRLFDSLGNGLNSHLVGGDRGLSVYCIGGCTGGGGGGGTTQLVDGSGNPFAVVSNPAFVTFTNATLAVTGAFYQATQPVSGTFFQATQPVSGTFWQATQPVSIATMPTTPVTGTFWQATQPVSGTFWQTTQPISGAVSFTAPQHFILDSGTLTVGTVSVSNFPAGFNVNNFPATQPISAASLPLPAGAATSSNQTNGNEISQVSTVNFGPEQTATLSAAGNFFTMDTTGYAYIKAVVTVTGSPSFLLIQGNIDGGFTSSVSNTALFSTPSAGITNVSGGIYYFIDTYKTMTITLVSLTGGTAPTVTVKAVGVNGPLPPTTRSGVTAQLVTGAAVIGKVGIDHTTPGTTDRVVADAGTNLNTSALALEGGNLLSIKNKTDNIPAQGQAAMSASTPVVVASDQSPIPITIKRGTTVTSTLTSSAGACPAGAGAYSTVMDMTGYSYIYLEVSGGATGNFFGYTESVNPPSDTNFGYFYTTAGGSGSTVITAGTGTYYITGLSNYFRLKCASLSAGTVTFKMTPVSGPSPVSTAAGSVASTQGTSPWVDNVSQFGGSNVVTGTGAGGAGMPRVTVSNDSKILFWDGTTTITVKAASTAAGATDTSLVVGLSPNSPLPTGTNVIGHVIVDSASSTGGNPCMSPDATLVSFQTTTSGTTAVQMIAASGSTKIYICSLNVVGVSGTTPAFGLVYGTGANCVTGQTTIIPAFTTTAAQLYPFSLNVGLTPASQAVCYLDTGTLPIQKVVMTYVQR